MPRKKQYQWHMDGGPETELGPSRSAKKRQCHALQALGQELTLLAPADWQHLDLPPDLLEALHLHARIRDKEGKRRQLQYIGRLMRHTDAEALQAALAARKDAAAADAARFHAAEQWRERLLTATQQELAGVVEEWLRHVATQADTSARTDWPALTAAAREEQARQQEQLASGKKQPPHARRALFRALATALAPAPQA